MGDTFSAQPEKARAMFVLMIFLSLSSVSATLYLQSLSKYPRAVCNNGQPATFYNDVPSNATKYIIGLQRGGECHTVEGCDARCRNSSSLCRPSGSPTVNLTGLFSTDATINPAFFNYHKTYIPLCSSDFHSGNRSASPATGGYHFRGKEIFTAVIATLKLQTDVANATTVVLAGNSAGGFGVLANCDFLRTLLPDVQDVRCVSDSAGFIPISLADECPEDDDGIFLDYIPSFWDGIPNDLCSRNTVSQTRKTNCYDLSYVSGSIRTPLFIITSLFDRIYMQRVCKQKLTKDTRSFFRQWGGEMRVNAERFRKDFPNWGLFMPSCYDHGLYMKDNAYSELLVGAERISMAQALNNWMSQSGTTVVWDECESMSVPCNADCDEAYPPPAGLTGSQEVTRQDPLLVLPLLFASLLLFK